MCRRTLVSERHRYAIAWPDKLETDPMAVVGGLSSVNAIGTQLRGPINLRLTRWQLLAVCCLKKNQNAPRPSEHPPVRGGNMSKRLGCCCCCLHIKSRSGLYSVLSNIRTGPTDADAFRGHRLTTQKGYTYQKEIKGPRKVNTHAII